MKEYSSCPRCLSPWTKDREDVLYCLTRCGMSYYPAQQPIMLCEGIIRYEDVLAWFLDTKNCIYRLSDEREEVFLPWLKFDIEAAKLKKYLLFT